MPKGMTTGLLGNHITETELWNRFENVVASFNQASGQLKA